MFFKTGILKIFAYFTGKHPCWNFFNNGAALQAFKSNFFCRIPPVAVSETLQITLIHFFEAFFLPKFEVFVLISLLVNLSLNQFFLIFLPYARQTLKNQMNSHFAWSCSLCEESTSFFTGLIFRKVGEFYLFQCLDFFSLSIIVILFVHGF